MLTRPHPYRPDRPTEPELAGGGVVRRPGTPEILLLHQRADDRWCLPKGHVEPGESVEAAALREITEETGLEELRLGPELIEVHYRFFDPAKGRNTLKIVIYFEVQTSSPEVALESGFDTFRWARLPEARRLLPFAEDHKVLEALRRARPLARRPSRRSGRRERPRRSRHAAGVRIPPRGKGFARRPR